MTRMVEKTLFVIAVLFVPLLFPLPGAPGGSIVNWPGGINPDSYPMIGDEELGQLRWALQVADKELDDFSDLEAINQEGVTAYRYSIAFLTYFLAAEQFHKLPAWPELIQPRMDRLIRKMILKPVWEFWAEVSRGVPVLEPLMNKPYPAQHDPVAIDNIMYSGHLGHMIALYEMLYRDLKWSRPGSIVFAWSDDEQYVYDNHSLQKLMRDQMSREPHCIPCEPNACFPECNQHPVLSFILYDYIHGTDLSEVNQLFLNFFLEKKMIDPRTHRTAALYLVKQDITVSQGDPRLGNLLDLVVAPAAALRIVPIESSAADGWTGAFMHAWQKEYIERHYPYMRSRHVIELEREDELKLKRELFEPRLNYGFFAMLAAEVGDAETRDKLLVHADRKYAPVWEDGAYHYPFDRDRRCVPLSGILLGLARALPRDGLWTMHNRPFDGTHFKEPKIEGVDFPALVLRRAIYDREKKALIVTYEPGAKKRGSSRLRIANLDPNRSYQLYLDGKPLDRVERKVELEVEVPLDGRRHLALVQE